MAGPVPNRILGHSSMAEDSSDKGAGNDGISVRSLACIGESQQRLLRLDAAHGECLTRDDTEGILEAITEAVTILVNEARDFRQLDLWLWRLERACRRHGPVPALRLPVEAQCALLLAMVFRQPRHPLLPLLDHRLHERLDETTTTGSQAAIAHTLLVGRLWGGRLRDAVPLLLHLARLSKETCLNDSEHPHLATLFLHIGRAVHEFLQGMDEACLATCDAGLALADDLQATPWQTHLQGFAVAALLASGKASEAGIRLDAMARSLDPGRRFDQVLYYMLRTWHEIDHGWGTAQARTWVEAHLDAAESLGAGIPLFCALHQRMLLAVQEQDWGTARHCCDKAHALAAHWDNPLLAFMCELGKASLAEAICDETAHAHHLESAFRLAREHDFQGAWWWPRDLMSRLCSEALARDIETAHVTLMLRRRPLPAPSRPDLQACWPWPVRIYTLGRFGVLVNGRPFEHGRKLPQMPLNLLRLLISLGGRGISREQVLELLWPDAEGDQGVRNLSVTLSRLRRLLDCHGAIDAADHRLKLDGRYCWVDAWAFERCISEAGKPGTDALPLLESALDHYQGPFLAETESHWAIGMRERLAQRFKDGIDRLCACHEHHRDWQAALVVYQRGLEAFPLMDRYHQGLVFCLLRLERHGEALMALQRCERLFRAYALPLPAWHAEILRRIRS